MGLGSTFAKNAALDACYGSTHAVMWPDTMYLHLYSHNPLIGGRELIVGVGGYEPILIPNNNTSWAPAVHGHKSNAATFAFPRSTGPWSGFATFWWLSDAKEAVTVPKIPTITVVGTGGTSEWQYVITALNAVGETQASGIAVTHVGNSVLSATNYNKLTWTAVATATGYNVYRKVGSAFERIASDVTTTTYSDTGAAPTAVSPPLTNGTMHLFDGGGFSRPVMTTAAGYLKSLKPGTLVIRHT